MKRAAALLLILATAVAQATVVPLKFREIAFSSTRSTPSPAVDTTAQPLIIGKVQVAGFDMLASPERKPPMEIDFSQDEPEHGLRIVTKENWVSDTLGNRKCRRTTGLRNLLFSAVDATSKDANGDVYILIEYFDNFTSGSELQMLYDKLENGTRSSNADGGKAAFGQTNQWKKQQFHLTNATAGGQEPQQADFALVRNDVPGQVGTAELAPPFMPYGSAYVRLTAQKPADAKLPELLAAKPLFGKTRLGDHTYSFVLDKQKPTDTFYNRLRFAESDTDLTTGTVLDASLTTTTSRMSGEFDPVSLSITVDGVKVPFRIRPEMTAYGSGGFTDNPSDRTIGNIQLQIRLACYYEGTTELDGKPCNFAFVDSDCNGRFDDKLRPVANSTISVGGRMVPYLRGDGLYISPDGIAASRHYVALPDYFQVGAKLYKMDVSTTQNQMTITQQESPAKITIPIEPKSIQLVTSPMAYAVAAVKPGKELLVPAGDYRLRTYTMDRTTSDGDVWNLSGEATDDAPVVSAKSGQEARMSMGEPFAVSVKAYSNGGSPRSEPAKESPPWWQFWSSEPGRSSAPSISGPIQLVLMMQGAGKESIAYISRASGNSKALAMSERYADRPKEATYKVMKTDGELVAQGTFAYG